MGITSCRTDRGRTTVAGDNQLQDGQRKDYGEWGQSGAGRTEEGLR